MKFQHAVFATVCCGLIFAGLCLADSESKKMEIQSPEAVVNEFYKYHFAHDMAFVPEEVKHRAVWLTPDLLKACDAYFALPDNPEEAPDIEGDVFTGSQEYPTAFLAGKAVISGVSARVPMTFTWDNKYNTKGTVVLNHINGKWLIDDVEFPDQESIRQLLKEEITQTAK